MFSILDVKKHKFTYYESEQIVPWRCDKVYTQAPKTNYQNWVNEICRNALDESLYFIGFTNETFIQNNNIGLAFHRKQPTVMACKTVLESLHLKKEYNYLVINAGGNKLHTMPFFRALQNLSKLDYAENVLLKTKLTKNIITLGTPRNSRSKYKINYLDYINSGFSVILGACEKHEYPYLLNKALKEAKNYIVFYSDIKDIKCNHVFQGKDNYNFYVYDVQNLDKPMQYTKIKKDSLSEADKFIITEQD